MTDQEIRDLAIKAGFKVWPCGRIGAHDGGVSGAATECVGRLVRLVAAHGLEMGAEMCDCRIFAADCADDLRAKAKEVRNEGD